ncbi:hypothetical protein [Nocardia sp. NBC_01009]|nr:hypothetical protein OHA42_06010 [Nocardia sp. NBC_01009]
MRVFGQDRGSHLEVRRSRGRVADTVAALDAAARSDQQAALRGDEAVR